MGGTGLGFRERKAGFDAGAFVSNVGHPRRREDFLAIAVEGDEVVGKFRERFLEESQVNGPGHLAMSGFVQMNAVS